MSFPRTGQRILVFAFSILFVCAVLIRASLPLSSQARPFGLGRLNELRANLPLVGSDARHGILIGTSTVTMQLDPRVMEPVLSRHGHPVKLFNIGLVGATPTDLMLLGRRVRTAFVTQNRSADLAIIEFNPYDAMAAARKYYLDPDNGYHCSLPRGTEYLLAFAGPPALALRQSTYCALFGQTSIGGLRTSLSTAIFERPFWHPALVGATEPVLSTLTQKLRARQQALGRSNPVDTWRPQTQGFLDLGADDPESRELLQKIVLQQSTPERKQAAKDDFCEITGCGSDITFDPVYIDHFIQLVRETQSFATHVRVLTPPLNPALASQIPVFATRLNQVLARISSALGMEFLRFDQQFGPNDFLDAFHLNPLGATGTYSQHVATILATDLDTTSSKKGGIASEP